MDSKDTTTVSDKAPAASSNDDEVPDVLECSVANITKIDGKTYLNDVIEFGEELGEGAFCRVFRVVQTFIYEDNGVQVKESLPYAMKICDKPALSKKILFGLERTETALDKLYREIQILKKLINKNVNGLFVVIDDPDCDKLYMVIDWADLGSIMTWDISLQYERNAKIYRFLRETELKGDKPLDECEVEDYQRQIGGALVESIAKVVFKQIAAGLAYIHRKNIAHRDLKWENILAKKGRVDNDFVVKIIDFSVSEDLKEDPDQIFFELQGTPGYEPPDFENVDGFRLKPTDVWAFGCCLYSFMFKKLPFSSREGFEVKFPEEVSSELRDLLQKVFEVDPEKRITVKEIVAHPWLD